MFLLKSSLGVAFNIRSIVQVLRLTQVILILLVKLYSSHQIS